MLALIVSVEKWLEFTYMVVVKPSWLSVVVGLLSE